MSETLVKDGTRQSVVGSLTASQLSTGSLVAVIGMSLDMAAWKTLSVTATAATNSVDVQVFGANLADFSDETLVTTLAPTTSAPAAVSYSPAPFRYYRLKAIDHVGGTHGTATATMFAKQ